MKPAVPAAAVRAVLRATRPAFIPGRLPLPVKRRVVDAVTAATRPPHGTVHRRASLGAVSVERVVPPGPTGGGVLLYLHGGGYVLGSAGAYRGVAGRLALAAGVGAVVADYRLAPEHPLPAALDDALVVYTALLEEVGSTDRLLVAGDSAGGGLALALLLALRERGVDQPAAAGLICPWLDLVPDIEMSRAPTSDPILRPEMTADWARLALAGADPRQAAGSPLHGDLRGLAPLIVHSALDDPLAVDAQRLEDRMSAEIGAHAIEHQRYPRRWHDFHLQAAILSDAAQALHRMGADLGRRLQAGEIRQRTDQEALPAERSAR